MESDSVPYDKTNSYNSFEICWLTVLMCAGHLTRRSNDVQKLQFHPIRMHACMHHPWRHNIQREFYEHRAPTHFEPYTVDRCCTEHVANQLGDYHNCIVLCVGPFSAVDLIQNTMLECLSSFAGYSTRTLHDFACYLYQKQILVTKKVLCSKRSSDSHVYASIFMTWT